jgi:serine/threonine-protein kinase
MNELIGRTLAGSYRVDAFIGKGGMSEVYKVWDRKRAVFLAMKVLHADMAEDKIFVRRFRREAQTLSRLEHPNIVRFYGLEQDDSLVFILMDHVEGASLRKELFQSKGPFPPQRVMEIVRPVCAALHYAHQSGFVHCDVKPANILIHANGTVQVSDFGIARMTETTTSTMVGAGTPAYMAPEQVRGEDPTPQTDIYSLGIVLYEMLSGGERPFTGEHARTTGTSGEKTRWEQLNLQPPPLRKRNSKVSAEVEAVVMKCMEKEAGKRFGNVMELLNALEESMAGGATVLPQARKKASKSAPAGDGAVPEAPAAEAQNAAGQPPSRKRPRTWVAWVVGLFIVATLSVVGILANRPIGRVVPLSTSIPTKVAMATLTSRPVPTQTKQAIRQATASPSPVPPTPTKTVPTTDISQIADMVLVPEGKFFMGSDDMQADEKPKHLVYLDAYWIDIMEVTNANYAACVAAGKCQAPSKSSSASQSSYYGNPEFNNFPVIYVSWYDATDYCDWMGRRLPTEAEWEKAARGEDAGLFPWGNDNQNPEFANYYGTDTMAVGSYRLGKSPYGALDMAGNVWEWVSDYYEDTYYARLQSDINPKGPDTGRFRVLRGGSWSYRPEVDIRSANRFWYLPGKDISGIRGLDNIGFRCARDK